MAPAPRFKSAIHFNILPPLQLFPTLDAALTSDIVVLLLSSVDEVQLEGEAILRCLQGQAGAVTTMACVQVCAVRTPRADSQAPESTPLVAASKSLVHKSLLSFSRYFFPSVAKIYSADTANEAILLGRALCETSPAFIHHPDGRAWLVAEEESIWEASAQEDLDEKHDSEAGTLRVTGTVRGGRLSANRLVHIPGHGDYQITEVRLRGLSHTDTFQIVAALPMSSRLMGVNEHAQLASAHSACLSAPSNEADDLTANNVPDLLANEQTWPTEEEMMGAQGAESQAIPKRVKRVPKGTSAYQAAWIFDDEDDEEAEGRDSEDDSEEMVDEDELETGKRSVLPLAVADPKACKMTMVAKLKSSRKWNSTLGVRITKR